MSDFNVQLAQVASSLQPVMFAPKATGAMEPCRSWRLDEFHARMADGRLSFADDAERQSALDLVHKAGSDMALQVQQMQLLAFLLNGAITACVHNADMSDSLISESMLYAASMRLDREESTELVSIVETFVNDIEHLFAKQFGVSGRLTADELRQLNDMKLLRWE